MIVPRAARLPWQGTAGPSSPGGTSMLIYSVIASLDLYTADAEGKFDWAEPDEEVFAFVNDQERGIGTYLYGRRMYETMRSWETLPLEGQSRVMTDFAGIWRAADKIVYSTTLRA